MSGIEASIIQYEEREIVMPETSRALSTEGDAMMMVDQQ